MLLRDSGIPVIHSVSLGIKAIASHEFCFMGDINSLLLFFFANMNGGNWNNNHAHGIHSPAFYERVHVSKRRWQKNFNALNQYSKVKVHLPENEK